MGDHSVLLGRSRSQQQHQRQLDDIDSNSDNDDYNYNNNIENAKLIDVERSKRVRRRHFRLSKRRLSITINGFLILFSVAVLFIITSQVLISIYYKDTYRTSILSGWGRNTSRYIPYYILPNQNTTLIDPIHLCATQKPILLLVIVCSSAINFEKRRAIRETWANTTEFNYPIFSQMHSQLTGKYLNINDKNWKEFIEVDPHSKISSKNTTVFLIENSSQQKFSIKIAFLVGQTNDNKTQIRINEESEGYNDLIQESFQDTYHNLTLKTVMMLKWVNNNCIDKVKYLMKCDDDTFVNIPNLIHVLLGGTVPVYDATLKEHDQFSVIARSSQNRLKITKNLLLGSRFCQVKPIGNASSKWYAPTYMFNEKVYPNYLSGAGYVMTMDTATKLYNASLSIPLFHLEDVYLTGICAKFANIIPQNHQLFSYMSFKNPCELKGMLTKHELTASDMRKAYEFVTNTTLHCPQPAKFTKVRRVQNRPKKCN